MCFDLSSGALDRLVTVQFVQCQCWSRHVRGSRRRIRWSIRSLLWWIDTHDRRKNVSIDRRPSDLLHPPRPFQKRWLRSLDKHSRREGFVTRRQAAAKWYVGIKLTITRQTKRCSRLLSGLQQRGNVLNHCKVAYITLELQLACYVSVSPRCRVHLSTTRFVFTNKRVHSSIVWFFAESFH